MAPKPNKGTGDLSLHILAAAFNQGHQDIFHLLIFIFLLVFRAIAGGTQGALLVMLRFKSGLAVCKARELPAILFLQPSLSY